MSDLPFTNRELKTMFDNIDEKLDGIHHQTIRTNGRVTKLERYALIFGTAIAVLLFTKYPDLAALISLF